MKKVLIAVLLAGCASSTPEAPAPAPDRPVHPVTQTEPQIAAQPQEPQPASKTPPTLADPKPLSLPQVVERTLDNGLRILVVEHHELPIVDMVMSEQLAGLQKRLAR